MAGAVKIQRIESRAALEQCAPLLAEVYNADPWNDIWTVAKSLEKLLCFFDSPKFLGLMAIEENTIIGCCIGNTEPYFTGDYFYLKEMFVSVKCQRSGVGSQLVNFLKEQLAIKGISSVILFTSRALFPYDFYTKNGFKEMEGMRMMNFEKAAP